MVRYDLCQKVRGPSPPPLFDLLHMPTWYDKQQSKFVWSKILQGGPCSLPSSEILVTRMLTQDMFAVANLLLFAQFIYFQ